MEINFGDCRNLRTLSGDTPSLVGYNWKKIHLGLIKIWFGYQLYVVKLPDIPEMYYGKHLKTLQINWTWKKET